MNGFGIFIALTGLAALNAERRNKYGLAPLATLLVVVGLAISVVFPS